MVIDYYTIGEIVKPIVEILDHHHLNEMIDLPTSENLLFYIAWILPSRFRWHKLSINETCTSSATLSRKEFQKNGIPQRLEKGERPERPQEAEETQKGDVTVVYTLLDDDDIPF
jgi:6-pyruvoyl-tetrahydropterin synthase